MQEWIGETTLDPLDFGWESCSESGGLVPKQGIGAICPDSIHKVLSCKCTKGCSKNKCSCKKHGLFCTTICECQDCQNVRTDNDAEFENDVYYDECEDDLDNDS